MSKFNQTMFWHTKHEAKNAKTAIGDVWRMYKRKFKKYNVAKADLRVTPWPMLEPETSFTNEEIHEMMNSKGLFYVSCTLNPHLEDR